MNVITVVGDSGVGKTTVASAIIRALKDRGRRVAAVKHSPHGHEPDRPGTDTDRFLEAGADVVIASSPGRTTRWERDGSDAPLQRVVDGPGGLGGSCDVVIAEGFTASDVPKILVLCRGRDPQRVVEPSTVLETVYMDEGQPPTCPPETAARLADLVEHLTDEKRVEGPLVTLAVDGEAVPLRPYPATVFLGLVMAMLRALKGVPEDPEEVSLTITRKA